MSFRENRAGRSERLLKQAGSRRRHLSPEIVSKLNEKTYVWPNMYDESSEMLEGSILMYAFSDLRTLAKAGKLQNSDKLITLPATVHDVLSVVSANEMLLKESLGDDIDLYINALKSIQGRRKYNLVLDGSSSLHIFDDSNSETELVYGIAVDRLRMRVTVGFRGSVTNSDFMCDANMQLISIMNPMADFEMQPQIIDVHKGFYDYLFQLVPGPNGEQVHKIDVILSEAMNLIREYPNFRLYVTGHSLGGALGTFFAFHAATRAEQLSIPVPVTCVSIASPKIGTLSFRCAFQLLERYGQLCSLRIVNDKDIVTQMPDRSTFSCLYLIVGQQSIFRHVGMELKLFKDKDFEVSYPKKNMHGLRLFLSDWKKQIYKSIHIVTRLPCICCNESYLKNHGCDEYLSRLEEAKRVLVNVRSKDLYEDIFSYENEVA